MVGCVVRLSRVWDGGAEKSNSVMSFWQYLVFIEYSVGDWVVFGRALEGEQGLMNARQVRHPDHTLSYTECITRFFYWYI